MPLVTASAVIAAEPEPIWALMSDPDRYPEFVPATHRMLDPGSGPFGVGYVDTEYGGVAPFIGENVKQIVEAKTRIR